MTVLICHCIRNEHDPRQVLVPDPTCPGCQHRHAARDLEAAMQAEIADAIGQATREAP